MDITKWLLDAETPIVTPLTSSHNFPAFMRAEQDAPTTHRSGPKGKRSSSDSSIIDKAAIRNHYPSREREKHRREPKGHRKVPRPKSLDSTSSAFSASSSSHPRSSFASSASPRHHKKTYERRPRHKTRTDKYDKHDKKNGKKKHYDDRKPQMKRTKRKSRKRTDPQSLSALLPKFKAPNVANDRLTLSSNRKTGLYGQGRASVSYKGKGLPDLVFSEMNFLRKRDYEEDDKDKGGPLKDREGAKKKQKRDRQKVQEEEISAFFGTSRRPDQQHTHHSPADVSSPARRPRPPAEVQPRSMRESSHPAQDLPGRPFLGFGSRGPQPQSTSCMTWSDSARITPVDGMRNSPVLIRKSGCKMYAHEEAGQALTTAALQSHANARPPAPAAFTDRGTPRSEVIRAASHEDRIVEGRKALNPLATSHRPDNNRQDIETGTADDQPIAPSDVDLPISIAHSMQAHDAPGDLTAVSGSTGACLNALPSNGHDTPEKPRDVELTPKPSSSPLTKLLRSCYTSLNTDVRTLQPPRQEVRAIPPPPPNDQARQLPNERENIRERFACPTSRPAMAPLPSGLAPQLWFPAERYDEDFQDIQGRHDHYSMLAEHPSRPELMSMEQELDIDGGQADHQGFEEAQYHGLKDPGFDQELEEVEMEQNEYRYGSATRRDIGYDDSAACRETDQLEGFWRPNRLY